MPALLAGCRRLRIITARTGALIPPDGLPLLSARTDDAVKKMELASLHEGSAGVTVIYQQKGQFIKNVMKIL